MGNEHDFGDADGTRPGGPRWDSGRGGYGPDTGYGGMPPGDYAAMPGPAGYDLAGGYSGYAGSGGYGDDDDDAYADEEYGGASHPAVHWGLICGIVLAVAMVAPFVVLQVAYPYYLSHPGLVSQSLTAKPDLGTTVALVGVTLVSVIVTPIALFLAGFLTTRETGTVGSGAFAGALGGGIAFVVYIFGNIFLTVVQKQTVPWDQLSATSHVLAGLAVGSGFLMSSCCGLVVFTLPPALIALCGAAVARLIWGPA